MRRSFLDDFSKKERLLGFLSDFFGFFASKGRWECLFPHCLRLFQPSGHN